MESYLTKNGLRYIVNRIKSIITDFPIAPMDFYVNSAIGEDITSNGTSVDKPWKTIQYAIMRMQERPLGSHTYYLRIADGVYNETININGLHINIIGNINDPSKVKIGDTDVGHTFYIYRQAYVSINGIEIISCNTFISDGEYAIIYAHYLSTFVIDNCIIRSKRTNSYGPSGIVANGKSFILIGKIQFFGTYWRSLLRAGLSSMIYLMTSCSINNSITVTIGCVDIYSFSIAHIDPVISKVGTITGKSYNVSQYGRLYGVNKIPSTTVAGTTSSEGRIL